MLEIGFLSSIYLVGRAIVLRHNGLSNQTATFVSLNLADCTAH